MLSFLCIALSSLGGLCAAEVSHDAQWPLVIELSLKNAPGFFSYYDIGSLAQVKKVMRSILLETASYRKAFIIEHISARLPKENIVWHKYATACAFTREIPLHATVKVKLQRGQLKMQGSEGVCTIALYGTILIRQVFPSPTTTESGHLLWCEPSITGHDLKREHLCSQPAFDSCGNAYVSVQNIVGGYKDSAVYHVLKSDKTCEKTLTPPF